MIYRSFPGKFQSFREGTFIPGLIIAACDFGIPSVSRFHRQVCLQTLWGATCWRRFARSCQSPGRSLSLVTQDGEIGNGICLCRLASGNVPWRCFVCMFFFGLLEGNAMEWVCFQVFQVLPTQLEASSFKGLMNSVHSQPRHTSALEGLVLQRFTDLFDRKIESFLAELLTSSTLSDPFGDDNSRKKRTCLD